MERLSCICCFVAVLALSGDSYAARIELQASEIATIQPEDSSLSPRVLVKWTVPVELSDKVIEGAFVQITLAVMSDEPLIISLMPMTRGWAAAQVEWGADWEMKGGDFDERRTETAILTDRNGGSVTMDVRYLVREILAGNRSDFGFVLVPDSTQCGKLSAFDANASTNRAGARLTVVYRDKRESVAEE